MESMGKKKPRPRRSFTDEFKAEIVELCQRGDRSVGQPEDTLDNRGVDDILDEGYSPAERPSNLLGHLFPHLVHAPSTPPRSGPGPMVPA